MGGDFQGWDIRGDTYWAQRKGNRGGAKGSGRLGGGRVSKHGRTPVSPSMRRGGRTRDGPPSKHESTATPEAQGEEREEEEGGAVMAGDTVVTIETHSRVAAAILMLAAAASGLRPG